MSERAEGLSQYSSPAKLLVFLPRKLVKIPLTLLAIDRRGRESLFLSPMTDLLLPLANVAMRASWKANRASETIRV